VNTSDLAKLGAKNVASAVRLLPTLVAANQKPALVNLFGNLLSSQLENVLIFTANFARNSCHQGNKSYNDLNCKSGIVTAAVVGSGQI